MAKITDIIDSVITKVNEHTSKLSGIEDNATAYTPPTDQGADKFLAGDGSYTTVTVTNVDGLQTALNGKVDENTAITGATKTKITYDSKGLVTGGADLSASDIPTLTASKISDFDTEVANNSAVTANTAKVSNVTTNLSTTYTTTSVKVVSSDGTDATISEASGTQAGVMSVAHHNKLDGIATGANAYTHPSSHPATMITEDVSHRFVTDSEKSTWNAKASTSLVTTTANGLMSASDKSKLNGIESGATADQTKADIDALGINAATVNGKTVLTNVPAGAVFTDTTYTANKGVMLTGNTFSIKGNEIPASVDLNTYRTTGFYTQNATADASSGSNYPTSNAGILQVINDDYGNGLHCTQLYSQYNSTNYYHRTYYNGAWSAWRNLAQDTNTVYTLPVASASLGGVKSGTDISVDASGNVSVVNDSHTHSPSTVRGISVVDTRAGSRVPNDYVDKSLTAEFTDDFPVLGAWGSAITMKGWADTYNAWQILGNASNNTSNQNLYYRHGTSTAWTDMAKIWSDKNDGSGSGLDADLLDGQQGSYYQPASTAITTSNIGSQSVSSATTATNALDSDKLNGAVEATAGTVNTIAKRDASGDVTARLFRSTYAEQTTAPAATADIAFRNSTTDNYIRFMDGTAFKSYCDSVGISVDGHTHSYLPLTGGTLTGDLTVNGGDIVLGGTGRIQGIDTVSADTDAINRATYATSTTGGTVKARLDGSTLYITTNGTNP